MDISLMPGKSLTRSWLLLRLKRGMTIEEIASERDMPIARVCQALEHFQLGYLETRGRRIDRRRAS